MTFADIPAGSTVFLDANTFVFHFAPEPKLGPACRDLLDRILRGEIGCCTSSHVLSNVAHRLMTIEAMRVFGWPATGIAYRLQQHASEVQKLASFRRSVDEVRALGVHVLPVALDHVLYATRISQQHGLLSGDALVVAMIHAIGLTQLASHDSDFDRVTGLSRFAPT